MTLATRNALQARLGRLIAERQGISDLEAIIWIAPEFARMVASTSTQVDRKGGDR